MSQLTIVRLEDDLDADPSFAHAVCCSGLDPCSDQHAAYADARGVLHYLYLHEDTSMATCLASFQLHFHAAAAAPLAALPPSAVQQPWAAFAFVPSMPGELLLAQRGSGRVLYATLPSRGLQESEVYLFGSFQAAVTCLVSNGGSALAGAADGCVKLWRMADGQLVDCKAPPLPRAVTALAFLGPMMAAVGDEAGDVTLLDLSTHKLLAVQRLACGAGPATCLAAFAPPARLAQAAQPRGPRPPDGGGVLAAPTAGLWGAEVAPDAQPGDADVVALPLLAVGSERGWLRVFGAAGTGEAAWHLLHTRDAVGAVTCLAFSRWGDTLAVGGEAGQQLSLEAVALAAAGRSPGCVSLVEVAPGWSLLQQWSLREAPSALAYLPACAQQLLDGRRLAALQVLHLFVAPQAGEPAVVSTTRALEQPRLPLELPSITVHQQQQQQPQQQHASPPVSPAGLELGPAGCWSPEGRLQWRPPLPRVGAVPGADVDLADRDLAVVAAAIAGAREQQAAGSSAGAGSVAALLASLELEVDALMAQSPRLDLAEQEDEETVEWEEGEGEEEGAGQKTEEVAEAAAQDLAAAEADASGQLPPMAATVGAVPCDEPQLPSTSTFEPLGKEEEPQLPSSQAPLEGKAVIASETQDEMVDTGGEPSAGTAPASEDAEAGAEAPQPRQLPAALSVLLAGGAGASGLAQAAGMVPQITGEPSAAQRTALAQSHLAAASGRRTAGGFGVFPGGKAAMPSGAEHGASSDNEEGGSGADAWPAACELPVAASQRAAVPSAAWQENGSAAGPLRDASSRANADAAAAAHALPPRQQQRQQLPGLCKPPAPGALASDAAEAAAAAAAAAVAASAATVGTSNSGAPLAAVSLHSTARLAQRIQALEAQQPSDVSVDPASAPVRQLAVRLRALDAAPGEETYQGLERVEAATPLRALKRVPKQLDARWVANRGLKPHVGSLWRAADWQPEVSVTPALPMRVAATPQSVAAALLRLQ